MRRINCTLWRTYDDRPISSLPPLIELTVSGPCIDNINALPPSLLSLTLLYFNNELKQQFPPNLTYLRLGDQFNQAVQSQNFPSSLKYLQFGDTFKQSVDNLPDSILFLRFGKEFNRSVDKLPKFLSHLHFGFGFNQKVNNLPQSLVMLVFGDMFNQPVDNLPSSLSFLYTGYGFNQKLDRLPRSLVQLQLGTTCWQPLSNPPNSITHLEVKSLKTVKSITKLPSSVTHFLYNGKHPDSSHYCKFANLEHPDYAIILSQFVTFEQQWDDTPYAQPRPPVYSVPQKF